MASAKSQPVRLWGGGGAPSHFESYADGAAKSNTCARAHAGGAFPDRVGFQTARERSSIGGMNMERKVREARRKAKAEARREKRKARRQQKAGAGSVK